LKIHCPVTQAASANYYKLDVHYKDLANWFAVEDSKAYGTDSLIFIFGQRRFFLTWRMRSFQDPYLWQIPMQARLFHHLKETFIYICS